jgi:hypothetical protein
MTEMDPAAIHREWLERLARGTLAEYLDASVSPAHRLHQSLIRAPLPKGARGIRTALGALVHVFARWQVHVEEQVADDARVCTRFVALGKHTGALGAMRASGAWLGVTGLMLSRFADGLAYDTWLEVNLFDTLRRAGALRVRANMITGDDGGHAETSATE